MQQTPESLNLARYALAASGPLSESLFLKVRLPGGAFWARYTFRRPPAGAGQPTGGLWAIWQDASGDRIAACDTHPAPAVAAGRDHFYVRIGPGELSMGRATGRVGRPGAPDHMEWDLTFATGTPKFVHFPFLAMYDPRFPGNKVCSPHVLTRFSGTVRAGGREFRVDGAPGMQGHNWGREVAADWVWGHCPDFRDAPGAALEVLSGAMRIGPVLLPYVTMIYLRARGEEFVLNRPDRMVAAHSRVTGLTWDFAGTCGRHRVEGTIRADPTTLVGLDYVSTDGSAVRCLSSDLADAEVRVTGPGGTFSLSGERTATLELGGRAAAAYAGTVPVMARG